MCNTDCTLYDLAGRRVLELEAASGPVIAVLLQCNRCNVHAQGFPHGAVSTAGVRM